MVKHLLLNGVVLKKYESVVGVVKSNGDLLFADEDGYFQGTITKDNKIEMCYLEAGKTFQIAMCRIIKKNNKITHPDIKYGMVIA